MSTVPSVVDRDQFAKFIGVEIVSAENGQARAKLVVQNKHMNGIGVVQGGAIFTLADTAFAAACNTRRSATVGIHANISYLKPGHGPVLWAEASGVRDGKIGCYDVKIYDGDDSGPQHLIASFQGLSYQLPPQKAGGAK